MRTRSTGYICTGGTGFPVATPRGEKRKKKKKKKKKKKERGEEAGKGFRPVVLITECVAECPTVANRKKKKKKREKDQEGQLRLLRRFFQQPHLAISSYSPREKRGRGGGKGRKGGRRETKTSTPSYLTPDLCRLRLKKKRKKKKEKKGSREKRLNNFVALIASTSLVRRLFPPLLERRGERERKEGGSNGRGWPPSTWGPCSIFMSLAFFCEKKKKKREKRGGERGTPAGPTCLPAAPSR